MRAMVLLIKGYVSTSALGKYEQHPITKEVFEENYHFHNSSKTTDSSTTVEIREREGIYMSGRKYDVAKKNNNLGSHYLLHSSLK